VPCKTANGKVALYVVNAKPEETVVETDATVLGKMGSGDDTTIILQIDKPTDVTVKRNGEVLRTASIK